MVRLVEAWVEADPESVADIVQATQRGLKSALDESRQKSADLESALLASVDKRWKGKDQFVRQQLDKWEGKTSFDWGWFKEEK